jgi:hypothetical protein
MADGCICNGIVWIFNPKGDQRWASAEALGFLPTFLDVADERPAREQLDANGYGGYWEPQKLLPDGTMTYPGDPDLPWTARAKLRDETIYFYPAAFVAIVQPDGSNVCQRMD